MKIFRKPSQIKKSRSQGFTLIELMIALAVVGILSAIALPSYNTYITKAKLKESMDFLEKAKLHVALYRQDGGKLSDLNNSNAAFTKLGLKKIINTKYLNSYWIAPWSGHDITIWVYTKNNAGLPSDASGKWLVYLTGNVENRGIKWECKSDFAADAQKYLPAKCR